MRYVAGGKIYGSERSERGKGNPVEEKSEAVSTVLCKHDGRKWKVFTHSHHHYYCCTDCWTVAISLIATPLTASQLIATPLIASPLIVIPLIDTPPNCYSND